MEFYDSESKFYELYLEKYADLEELVVKANEEDTEAFMNYTKEYELSCTVSDAEKNDTEVLADSFMFFVASGVIISSNGCYNINVSKVKALKEQYNKNCKKPNVFIKK